MEEPDPLQSKDDVRHLDLEPHGLGVQVLPPIHRDEALVVERDAGVLKLVECELADLAPLAEVRVPREVNEGRIRGREREGMSAWVSV